MQAPSDPRVALVEATLKTVELKLNSGTAGNLSLRHGEGMLITPTGIPPRELGPEQIVEMDLEGNWEGRWKPSSEWAIHSRLYQTTSAGAVVHAHPDNCVALAALRRPMPPFHYMIAGFGGNIIPCAPYACFGTPALAETVVAAMGTTYAACLMSNHGIVTTGRDLASALVRAEKLEMLARQYLLACAAGEPVLLSEEELTEVHSRYGTYGQQ
ncbi:MAG: class II aldolase/adducin family protein [Proteobacteria bacterium]|nr:class II aldolase/adducin family protein [Pseudomonadota bacterium]